MTYQPRSEPGFRAWAKRLLSGKPHFVIYNSDGKPQLLRWWLIPRNGWFNIYLHHTLCSDDDRALHDHPWDSVSFLVAGQLSEVYDKGQGQKYRRLPFLRPVFRGAETAHRLMTHNPHALPWTVFVTFRKRREWGFLCPKGWTRWQDFVKPDDPGKPKGCE